MAPDRVPLDRISCDHQRPGPRRPRRRWARRRRLPEVFHDPRALAAGGKTRACLHAKCIVVDEDRALVTSANFTEAAHERNVEAGLLIADRQVARALRAQFETLVECGALRRVPGL